MTLELFLSVAGFVATLVGGAWLLLSLSARQFDRRLVEKFAALEVARAESSLQWQRNFDQLIKDREEEEREWRRVERELNALRVELPKEYVRREDHIRFETVINAKLDSVAAKLDLANERNKKD
jgi:hypothetical protein